MPWYETIYEPWPVAKQRDGSVLDKYGSFIWAKSRQHARALAEQRRIGEIVGGVARRKATPRPEPAASELLKPRMTPKQRVQFLHAVTFLAFVYGRSRGADLFTLLGDEGLVHQAVHAMQHGWPPRAELRETLRHFERRTPGYTGRWSGP